MVKLLLALLIYSIYILYLIDSNFYICLVSKIKTHMLKDTDSTLYKQWWISCNSFYSHYNRFYVTMQRKTKQNTIDYFPLFARYTHSILIGTRTWRCGMLCLRSVIKYNILLTSCSCFQTTRYVTYELSGQLNKFSCLNVPTFFSENSS